jgi:peroxiredoxin Q/BCP
MVHHILARRYSMSLEGTKAPPFALEGSDGRNHALSDYCGKTFVIFFYPKDSTPG